MPAVAFVADQPAARCDRSLRRSLAALDHARQCSVLWFADIMARQLYRELGYATINQYARQRLGFSKSRCGDFIRLAQKLEALPRVKAAVADGSLGYTKAREIVTVATAKTEAAWLEAAQRPRRELAAQVKRVKAAAKANPAQAELLPAATVVAPAELPVRLIIELTPEQEARRAALVEKLHKQGGAPADRAELLLEALAALVESRAPRGAPAPPVQIHVHEEADGTLAVETDHGRRTLAPADADRCRCDAAVSRPGRPDKATIPPRLRRQVLARDRHRCRAPGCGRTRFLEVHHVKARADGGGHDPTNLVTLCAACHRLWHERRGPTPASAPPAPRRPSRPAAPRRPGG